MNEYTLIHRTLKNVLRVNGQSVEVHTQARGLIRSEQFTALPEMVYQVFKTALEINSSIYSTDDFIIELTLGAVK